MILIIIAAVIVAALMIYMILLAPGHMQKDADLLLRKSMYAHRGLHIKDKSVPENSMPAFEAAIAAGCGIELDINISADGKVVVFHDNTLLRVCGVDRVVSDCTYEELKSFRLHDTEERIPLFSEVLALIDGRVPILVELKPTPKREALCEYAARFLDEYNGLYCIESFHPSIVRWFKKNRPQVLRGFLCAGIKRYNILPLYQGILLSSLLINFATRPHFVSFNNDYPRFRFRLFVYKLLGGKILGWTIRDTDDIPRAMKYYDTLIFEFFKPQTRDNG